MLKKKIYIIGNSVTLRVRPKIDNESEIVYSSLLEKLLDKNWRVIKHGKSRYLTSELINEIDIFLNEEADIYIINMGCVDAPPRDISKWYSDVLFKRKKTRLYPFFKIIYDFIKILKVRSLLVRLRGQRPWVSIEDFKNNMVSTIQKLKENKAEIIVIGINKGSERLEKHLPGILNNYQNYNKVLEEISEKEKVRFLDVQDLNHKEHFPDGVHYNENGHKIISERLLRLINE